MRSITLAAAALAAALAACSCSRDAASPSSPLGGEIVLDVDGGDIGMDVDTKATAVTAVPSSLYWGATTGTKGTANASTGELSKWAPASATVSSSKISTGKYQTATATAYNYYVSNANFAFTNATASAAGYASIAAAANTTDIVCGATYANSSVTPSVALNHIFARMGTIQIAARSGYTYSSVSYTIASKSGSTTTGTTGRYNITTGAWSGCTALASTAIASGSDMYLIPGTYSFTVKFTRTIGDNVQTFTKTVDLTLTAGKIHNITITDGTAGPTGITISLTLTAWATQAVSLSVS